MKLRRMVARAQAEPLVGRPVRARAPFGRAASVGRAAVGLLADGILSGWREQELPRTAAGEDGSGLSLPAGPPAALEESLAGGAIGSPLRRGLTAATLAAILAVAPVAAQAPQAVAPSADGDTSRQADARARAADWPAVMGGQLVRMGPRTAITGVAGGAEEPLDDMFDARGALRPPAGDAPARPSRTYEVTLHRTQAGDSAWSVARLHGVSTMTVWWANRMEAWERLRVGQLLRVLPVSGIEHVVRDGDTLDSIARAYDADADAIAEFNRLEGGVVLLGQRLLVPDGRGGRYVALDEVRRSASVPRLRPGQADRAPVDHEAVASPLLAPVPTAPTGVKGLGGVAWPADPDGHAGPIGPVDAGGPWPDGSPGVATPDVVERPWAPVWDPQPVPGIDPPTPPVRPGWSDGPDRFPRLGFVGERPGAAPDQPAGETATGGRETGGRDGSDGTRRGGGRDPLEPNIVIPDDAPIPNGHGARDTGWPDGGPAPGPKHGHILTIDDPRLKLTAERALRQGSLLWPVYGGGRLTQHFHDDHAGIDIADLRGTPILAAQSGRVVFAGWRDERAGNIIYLKHGPEFFTGYGHLWRFTVEAGDRVKRGQVIGYMGSTGFSTGSHLHFVVTDGPLPNYHPHAQDPLLYLPRP